jgi:hypothetical protein
MPVRKQGLLTIHFPSYSSNFIGAVESCVVRFEVLMVFWDLMPCGSYKN